MPKNSMVITFRINDVDDPDIFKYFDIVAPRGRSALLRQIIRNHFNEPPGIVEKPKWPQPGSFLTVGDDPELRYEPIDEF